MMAAALALGAVGGRWGMAAAAGLLVLSKLGPVGSAAFAVAAAVGVGTRNRSRRRRRTESVRSAELELADLVALALLGGHNVAGALSLAASHADADVAAAVDRVLRARRHRGIAVALLDATGPAAGLFAVMGRAVEQEGSVRAAVAAYSTEKRAESHALALERAQRLPVLLLFPLALLVLPGFMLLLIAPAVATAIERLGL